MNEKIKNYHGIWIYFKSEFLLKWTRFFFISRAASFTELLQDVSQGPVVGRLINANPKLNLIQASLSFLQSIFSNIFLYSF